MVISAPQTPPRAGKVVYLQNNIKGSQMSTFTSPMKTMDNISPSTVDKPSPQGPNYHGNISMRVDQPVQGCALRPHAFFRKPQGMGLTATKLIYRWYRSPRRLVCANESCPNASTGEGMLMRATMECMVCAKLTTKPLQACFCSADCFRNAWPKHAMLHAQYEAKNQGQGQKEARPRHAKSQKQAGGDEEEDAMVVDTPNQSSDEWGVVSFEKTYTPTTEDVGYVLKVECRVVGEEGNLLLQPKAVETNIVLPLPPAPPARQFIHTSRALEGSGAGRFRVLSYNLLSEIYATRQVYPYCPLWALQWDYRKNLLIRDMLQYDPDVLCLQEAQADHFEEFLYPTLSRLGYDGVYKQKTRESMGIEGKVDGCALFYKRVKFALREKYVIEFNEAAVALSESKLTAFKSKYPRPSVAEVGDFSKSSSLAMHRLLKDNVAQVVVLDCIGSNFRSTTDHSVDGLPPAICVANTHILSNPEFVDVKLWQTHTLIRELEKLTGSRELPLVLCGDFNSEPISAVYEMLSTKSVSANHRDLSRDPAKVLPQLAALGHSIPLASSYSTVLGSEPSYTNYTGHWTGVVDYVWYTKSSLEPVGVLQLHEPRILEAQAKSPLPNCQFPSDHVPLVVDLQLRAKPALRMSPLKQTRQGVRHHSYQARLNGHAGR